MGRKKLVEKHEKQKTKLQKTAVVEQETSVFVRPPALKETAYGQALKNGYKCVLQNSILFFQSKSVEENEKIRAWLLENFGKEETIRNHYYDKELGETETNKPFMNVKVIPFSYGFGNIFSSSIPKVIEKEEAEEESELEEDVAFDDL